LDGLENTVPVCEHFHSVYSFSLKVFPNPAETYFYIDFNADKLIASDNICTVFNLYGSKIMEFDITNDHQKINCSNWKKGIYIIKVSNKETLIGSTKILIY
jgi:hypothetical protein